MVLLSNILTNCYKSIYVLSKSKELKIKYKANTNITGIFKLVTLLSQQQTPLNDSWRQCLRMQLRVRRYIISHFVWLAARTVNHFAADPQDVRDWAESTPFTQISEYNNAVPNPRQPLCDHTNNGDDQCRIIYACAKAILCRLTCECHQWSYLNTVHILIIWN